LPYANFELSTVSLVIKSATVSPVHPFPASAPFTFHLFRSQPPGLPAF
jgi:hypothetical protein